MIQASVLGPRDTHPVSSALYSCALRTSTLIFTMTTPSFAARTGYLPTWLTCASLALLFVFEVSLWTLTFVPLSPLPRTLLASKQLWTSSRRPYHPSQLLPAPQLALVEPLRPVRAIR